jgi:Protein of unknown function (DUF2975)
VGSRVRNPLEPFASVVRLIAAYLMASLIVYGIASLISDRRDMFGAGDVICAEQANVGGSEWNGAKRFFADEVTAGVEPIDDAVLFCRTHPANGQTALQVLTELPHALLALTAFLLLWQLVGKARRHGPFSPMVAVRVRMLGWLLLAGGYVAEAVQEIADLALLKTMLRQGAWNQPHLTDFVFAGILSVSPGVLVTGLGLLTVSRVLDMGVQMREDLAAKA